VGRQHKPYEQNVQPADVGAKTRSAAALFLSNADFKTPENPYVMLSVSKATKKPLSIYKFNPIRSHPFCGLRITFGTLSSA